MCMCVNVCMCVCVCVCVYVCVCVWVSHVTCGDHFKWITDEKSRKDRSVSKGETMSKENGRHLKEES